MDDLQKDALEIYARISELKLESEDLKDQLDHDPRFLRMRACEEEILNLESEFKERAKNTLQVRGEKSSQGDFGKITLVNHETYKVSDEKLVPEKYFTKAVDLKLVKRDMGMLGKAVPGIAYTNTVSVRVTPKTCKESS